MPDVIEPLRRLGYAARRPAPIVGFERPPARLVASLRAAAAETAAAAATLALLEAAPKRSGEALLIELAERQQRAEVEAHEALRVRWSGIEPRVFSVLALALADVARGVHDAAAWWCRAAGCEPELTGMAGALRDAMREVADAIDRYPDPACGEAALAVNGTIWDGRRLARRARAAAIERGELGDVLGRLSAIAAVERALRACGRAASALQRLSA